MDIRVRTAILHGAGYVGAELIRLIAVHPHLELTAVTSRSFAGRPLSDAHTSLRGSVDASFVAPDQFDVDDLDAVFVTAEHGQGAVAVRQLRDRGFTGRIVDLSNDFRLADPAVYEARFEQSHPAPDLLADFVYGLAEVNGPYAEGTMNIANPGCFASGLALSLWPVSRALGPVKASVTALTGSSGSGTRPSATTHFSTRDGNVRAYKVLSHQHLPEVLQVLGPGSKVDFVPVSGPWTRGIWGTAHIELPAGTPDAAIASWFDSAYGKRSLVRCWPGQLPELRWSVGSPFCDIGWVRDGRVLVIGFALDNLLKGAAGQAVQNLNLMLGLSETTGLLPGS